MSLLSQSEVSQLTPQERLAIIAQLWDSFDDKQLPLSPAQAAELDRRLSSIDADRQQGTSWEALRAELARRSA